MKGERKMKNYGFLPEDYIQISHSLEKEIEQTLNNLPEEDEDDAA